MPVVTKLDLHVARSIEELQGKSEINRFGNKDIKRILDFAEHFYRRANEDLLKGDDENAYIFFYRFMTMCNYVSDNEIDQKKFMERNRSRLLEAIEKLEILDNELTKRYEEKKKNYNDRRAKLFDQPIPGTSVTVKQVEEIGEDQYPCIDSKQLVQLILSLSEINKLLIIDIRLPKDFGNSSIAANKFSTAGEINFINIPGEILTPALTYSELRTKISLGFTLDGLERRRSMDYVIIVDENSIHFERGCKSYILADALWKWDQSPDRIKKKPMLLKGGYFEFVLTYPTYTTNSCLIDEYTNMPFERPKQIKKMMYDFLEEEKPKESNQGNSTAKSPSIWSNHAENRSSVPENQLKKVPGIAVPISTIPVIPDRSLKPTSIKSSDRSAKEESEELAEDDSDSSYISLNTYDQTLVPESEASNLKDGDRDRERSELPDEASSSLEYHDCSNNAKVFVSSDLEETASNNSLNEYVHPINENGETGHWNLSRSLSSPNIAQSNNTFSFGENSIVNGSKFAKKIPFVDRSVKPYSSQVNSRSNIITGLRNLGNTCFMNSVLQCLKNTTEFYEYLLFGKIEINPDSKFGSNGELTIELIELFKQMHFQENYRVIAPKEFMMAVSRHIPDFVRFKQQDAHEFLVRLLDRIHADLNRCKPGSNVFDPSRIDPNYYDRMSMEKAVNNFLALHSQRCSSIVTDLFEGLIVNTVTCLHCNFSSKSLEAPTCLSLPIQDNVDRTSLRICLDHFLRGERISNEVAWQCQKCQQKRAAEKRAYIWKLPKVLIIHLKRFSQEGFFRKKMSTLVQFPIDDFMLETSKHTENRTYELYGVVNHIGSLESGHYMAYSRDPNRNIGWHEYNDQDVTEISSREVITPNAYVLFYKSKK